MKTLHYNTRLLFGVILFMTSEMKISCIVVSYSIKCYNIPNVKIKKGINFDE